MNPIVPAILPSSREDLEEKLGAVIGIAEMVQIDAVDGQFASPATWPYINRSKDAYSEENPLPYLGQLEYEIDLMVRDPEKIAGAWIAAGAQKLVFHCESSANLYKAISSVAAQYGHAKDFAPALLSLGIAFNIETDLAQLAPFLEIIDYVQLMGIAKIGKQGQPFDPKVLQKIAQCREKYPDVLIQVDGGVNIETAPQLLSAGVNRLVIGSALWKAPNFKEQMQQFEELAQEYGIYL